MATKVKKKLLFFKARDIFCTGNESEPQLTKSLLRSLNFGTWEELRK